MKNKSDNQGTSWPDLDVKVRYKKDNSFMYLNQKISKYKNLKLYKAIYDHPFFSMTVLILWGVIILILFVTILFTLYKKS
jgi:hypothetical protein